MKLCVFFAVFCAIAVLTQVKAKTLEDADRGNIDLKEELKELVEAIDMRHVAQEEQGKRAYCPGKYRCLSDDCIPISWICDGEADCPDGDDERVCRDPDCDRHCRSGNGGCKSWEGKCAGYCYCYGSGYAQFCDDCRA